MLANIAIIVLITLSFAYIFKRMQLPELLGMIFAGILLGPYTRNLIGTSFSKEIIDLFFISDGLLKISQELRTAALIVILIRAGLGINKKSLKQIGGLALKMGSIPIMIEAIFLMSAGRFLLGLSFVEASILAFTIAAVSPAIIVPGMIDLKEKKFGENKSIPTMILAGASIDVIIAITFFGIFVDLGNGGARNIVGLLLNIPISIITGIFIGLLIGQLFVSYFKKNRNIRDTKKVLIFMTITILFNYLEKLNIIPIASLIGIISMGYIILSKYDVLAKRLSVKFSKVWVIAEIILFVLIGAVLDISQLPKIGFSALLIIFIGLLGRSIGVFTSLIKSELNFKERLFCVIAYTPKATVQAALGAIPLALGINSGETILAIAVLSIVITAPLGSILIKIFADKLLNKSI